VLYTGIWWEFLPQELGCGSGMTCWRRLRYWNAAEVWQRLHELLPAELRGAGALDFSRAAGDSSHLRAMKGGPATGRSPVDRGKTGSKHHVVAECHGSPLASVTTGGNRNDVTPLLPLLQAIPPMCGRCGRPGSGPTGCTPTAATTEASLTVHPPCIPNPTAATFSSAMPSTGARTRWRLPGGDQRVDLAGALVGKHGLEVVGMPQRRVLQADAVCTEDRAALESDGNGFTDVVSQ
jgi:transposase